MGDHPLPLRPEQPPEQFVVGPGRPLGEADKPAGSSRSRFRRHKAALLPGSSLTVKAAVMVTGPHHVFRRNRRALPRQRHLRRRPTAPRRRLQSAGHVDHCPAGRLAGALLGLRLFPLGDHIPPARTSSTCCAPARVAVLLPGPPRPLPVVGLSTRPPYPCRHRLARSGPAGKLSRCVVLAAPTWAGRTGRRRDSTRA